MPPLGSLNCATGDRSALLGGSTAPLEEEHGQPKTNNGEQAQRSPTPNPGEWPVFGQQRSGLEIEDKAIAPGDDQLMAIHEEPTFRCDDFDAVARLLTP